jgi:hypothetical protein
VSDTPFTYSRDQDVRLLEDALAAGKDVCARVSEGPYSNEWLDALAALDRIVAGSRSLEEQLQAYEDEINERTSDQALTLRKLREEQERAGALVEQLEAFQELAQDASDITQVGHGLELDVPVNLGSVKWVESAYHVLLTMASLASNPATRPEYPCDCGPDEYCSSDQCHGAVPDPASTPDTQKGGNDA